MKKFIRICKRAKRLLPKEYRKEFVYEILWIKTDKNTNWEEYSKALKLNYYEHI